jgi:hypothetical protein
MLFVVICSVGILFVLVALPSAFRRKRPMIVRYRRHASPDREDFKQPEKDALPLPMPVVPKDQNEYEEMAFYWSQNPEKYPYPTPPLRSEQDSD